MSDAITSNLGARLNKLDRSEMWNICHDARPDWTEEMFDRHWAFFCRLKTAPLGSSLTRMEKAHG